MTYEGFHTVTTRLTKLTILKNKWT